MKLLTTGLCLIAAVLLAACGGAMTQGRQPFSPTTQSRELGPLVNSGLAAHYVFVSTNDVNPIGGGPELVGYNAPFGHPFLTQMHLGIWFDHGLAKDSSGDLFVLGSDFINEYKPPYTGAPTQVDGGAGFVSAMGMDASQNLYGQLLGGQILMCPPPYSTCTTIIGPGQAGQDFAVSPNGNIFSLFVTSSRMGELLVFEPPYTGGPSVTISLPSIASIVDVDKSNDVFVGIGTGLHTGEILEYTPPYTGSAAVTVTNQVPGFLHHIIFDGSGDMFVSGRTEVQEYAPPYTGAPIATINLSKPIGIALDGANNLYVADWKLNQIYIYAPPYSGLTKNRIHFGLNRPGDLITF